MTKSQPITDPKGDAAPCNGGIFQAHVESDILGKMKKDFLLEEKIGAPINPGLAGIIDKFLSEGCDQGSIEGMKYARPANVEFMQKIKVNSSLWPTLNKTTKWNDVKYQQIHETIMLGMMPLIEVANTCLNTAMKKEQLTDAEGLFKKLSDSIAVLADACHEVGMTRKRALRPSMKEQYRSLCGQEVPITRELFGDNLPTAAKDLGEINKLANTITIDRGRGRSFGNRRGGRSYRGGGRGQGSSGYNQGYNQGYNAQRGTPQQRGRGNARRPGFPRARRGAV